MHNNQEPTPESHRNGDISPDVPTAGSDVGRSMAEELTLPAVDRRPVSEQEEPSVIPQVQMSWWGDRSKLVVEVGTHADGPKIEKLTVYGLGLSGQRLVEYATQQPLSKAVSDTILARLHALPSDVNIDTHLLDMHLFVRSETGAGLSVIRPLDTSGSDAAPSMKLVVPSFRVFASNPSRLGARYAASWRDGTLEYTVRGTLDSDATVALLRVKTVSAHGIPVSTNCFSMRPLRAGLISTEERHRHLQTRLWEAIELCRERGIDGLERHLNDPSAAAQTRYNCLGRHKVVRGRRGTKNGSEQSGQVVYEGARPGGPTVSLTLGHEEAHIVIRLPFPESLFQASLRFSPSADTGSFSDIERTKLRMVAAHLTASEVNLRRQACYALLQAKPSVEFIDTVSQDVYGREPAPSGGVVQVHDLSQSLFHRTTLNWLLDGYHCYGLLWLVGRVPIFFNHFSDVLLGVSPSGGIRAWIRSFTGEQYLVNTPESAVGTLHSSVETLNQLCRLFRAQDRVTWQEIAKPILSLAEPGGRSERLPSCFGTMLPSLDDRDGVEAFDAASLVLEQCAKTQFRTNHRCLRTYSGGGEAFAILRYPDLAGGLGARLRGRHVVEFSVYEKQAGIAMGLPENALKTVAVPEKSRSAEETLQLVAQISNTFARLQYEFHRVKKVMTSDELCQIFLRAVNESIV